MLWDSAEVVDKEALEKEMVDILQYVADKEYITTASIVSYYGFPPTTAKRYLRQLTDFGYLKPAGGNKNRTYSLCRELPMK